MITEVKRKTVIIPISDDTHDELTITVNVRKTLGGYTNPFELEIGGKFFLVRGRISKGDNGEMVLTEAKGNKHLIKAFLGTI